MIRLLKSKIFLFFRFSRLETILIGAALFFNLLTWMILGALMLGNDVSRTVYILHYTTFFGIDKLGNYLDLAKPIILASVILLVNGAMAIFGLNGAILIRRIFLLLTVIFEIIILAYAVIIFLLNK